MPRIDPTADRLLVVLSDIEMGAGGVLEDFRHDDWLAELLEGYCLPPYADVAVDFVFNGDTFDFMKTPGLAEHPHHVSEHVALQKLGAIAEQHPRFFLTLGRLLAHDGAPRRIHLITGNHDLELCFQAVRAKVRQLAGLAAADDRLSFAGFELDLGEVHIEHGSQADPLFRVDPDRVFVTHGGRTLLAQPWGAVVLLATAIPLGKHFAHLDRVKPRQQVFDLLPESKELLLKLMWEYWTRSFVRDVFEGADPLKTINWGMLKEVLYRFGSGDMGVGDAAKEIEKAMRKGEGPRLAVFGHLHSAGWRSIADRKILVTGAMRDEFTIDSAGSTTGVVSKTYAEVWMAGSRVLRSELVEVRGPEPRDVPQSIFDFKAGILEVLGTEEQRKASIAARLKHEVQSRRARGFFKGRRTG